MTDIETGAIETTHSSGRKRQAKAAIGQAGETLKSEAKSFAGVAQDRVRAEAQKGTKAGAKTLGDFAGAVRRAGDELAEADQSPASRLVQRAADGLETLSRNLADKDPGDLLNDLRDFGRRNPAAFIGGAMLVGLALGRFARASDEPKPPGLADDDLALAEEATFDGPAEAGRAGIDRPVSDNLGDLAASNVEASATPVGFDDGSAGVVQPGPTSPSSGTR